MLRTAGPLCCGRHVPSVIARERSLLTGRPQSWPLADLAVCTRRRCALAAYGALGGGTRRFVACSKAYAISISRPSVHGMLVKLTPYGAGRALNPGGNGGLVGAFGI